MPYPDRLQSHGITKEQAENLPGEWREYFGLPYHKYAGTICLDSHKKLHDAEDPQLRKFGE